MIEKIRVSLWDIFTFLMSGLLAFAGGAVFAFAFGLTTPSQTWVALKDIPVALLLAAGPVICTLVGMLLEPFANHAERYVLRRLLAWSWKARKEDENEELALLNEIRTAHFGNAFQNTRNTYQICKDYIEAKGVNTPFMIYLSRFGFYRNCTFLAISFAMASLFFGTWRTGAIGFLCCMAVAIVTRRRQLDFYSYMAPTVYRAFLVSRMP